MRFTVLTRLHRALAVLVAITLTQIILLQTALAAEPASDLALLEKGQVIVRNGPTQSAVPSVSAKILIPRPPDQVWKMVLQPEGLMARERKVKRIKVLSKTPTASDLEYTVNMAKVLPTLNYTLRHQVANPNTLSFRRTSGSFNDIRGYWQVTPTDGGKSSILTYQLSIDPGPLMPRFMMQSLLKSDLPQMMKNVKAVMTP